jgi:hypothetical protein
MTPAKTEKKVGDLRTRADGLVERMQGIADRYLEAIVPWVSQRFEADVAAAVVGAPGATEDLGAEGLGRLRSALSALVASTSYLVHRRVDTRGAWPHRWDRDTATIPEGLYGAKAGGGRWEATIPAFLQQRLRVLLGASAHLLARFGYQSYVRRTWDRAYVRSDYFPPEYLARSLDGHEEFHPLLAEYGAACDEYSGLLAEMRQASRERLVKSAAEAWKQA